VAFHEFDGDPLCVMVCNLLEFDGVPLCNLHIIVAFNEFDGVPLCNLHTIVSIKLVAEANVSLRGVCLNE